MGAEITKIAVIGAGSWGTTLANLLAEKGLDVDLWVREEEVLHQIRNEHTNRVFLPGAKLNQRLKAVGSFDEALFGKQLVVLAVPSHVFRKVFKQMVPFLKSGMSVIMATKGIENETQMIMSQVVESILPGHDNLNFACLAGPSFAKEVWQKYPTAVTIACNDLEHAERLQRLFSTDFFRVYVSGDLTGVQLGGALKNVIAVAAGTADGLKFGHNARAALITRGLAEITRLGVAMGANPHTFAGLAGMGDIVLTCTGDLSRNRMVGLKIGKGMSLEEITATMKMVAEGINTTRSARDLGRKIGVDMPITNQVYQMLYNGKGPKEAVKELMSRQLKPELEN
ncbi:MAG: NAD(P)H-dependent glycerol-3-phosphate dehydrogenase [Thermodesulfobacteriota bacterium]|nr:NAD(P)H-dependent glycerol-3-phosphate dehydrogenase [Thermodesulfobacteriota bacterium]